MSAVQSANSSVFREVEGCLETTPRPAEVVTVLCVSPFKEDHQSLQSIFAHSNWNLHGAQFCPQAVEYLRLHPIPVVVSEKDLAEYCWKHVLRQLEALPRPRPRLIVTSRLADDHLWSEVLNLGGYNVLEKPFDRREVFWVVSHAWLDWKSEWDRFAGHRLSRTAHG